MGRARTAAGKDSRRSRREPRRSASRRTCGLPRPGLRFRVHRSFRSLVDDVGGLLSDGVDRADDEEAGDLREHRGVDDAQALRAVDLELRVDDAAILWVADLARARGVMPPGVVLDELGDLPGTAHVLARQLLLGDESPLAQLRGQAAHELDGLDDRLEVLHAFVRPLGQVAEVDLGRVARIGRLQPHRARAVLRVRLEDGPGEVVQLLREEPRVAGEVAFEQAEKRKDEEVGEGTLGQRLLDHCDHRAVRRVDAGPLRLPLGVLRIAGRELGALQHRPFLELHPVDDGDFVAVLQVRADARQVDEALDIDVLMLEVLPRPDAGEHEELRRIERAAGEDDLARDPDVALLARAGARVRGGAGEARGLEVLDAGGALVLVEDDAGRQRVELDEELVGMLLHHVEHALAGAVAGAVLHRQRRVADAGRVALDEAPVVRIALAEDEPFEALDQRAAELLEAGRERLDEEVLHLLALDRRLRDLDLGVQPATEAVPRRIDAREVVDPAPDVAVMAVLEALKILAHLLRRPRPVAGQVGDVLPVGGVRIDGDESVVRRAAAEGAGARVEHAVDRLAVVRLVVLVVLLRELRIFVVLDPEVPLHRVVLGGDVGDARVGGVGGEAVLFRERVAALELARIAARFEQQHRVAVLGEAGGDGAAARSRSDYDVLIGVGHRPQNVFRNAIRAFLSASVSPGSPSLAGRKSVPKYCPRLTTKSVHLLAPSMSGTSGLNVCSTCASLGSLGSALNALPILCTTGSVDLKPSGPTLRFDSRLTGVPFGIGPMLSPSSPKTFGKSHWTRPRKGRPTATRSGGRYPRGTLRRVRSVVRSIHPGAILPDFVTNVAPGGFERRRSGQSI